MSTYYPLAMFEVMSILAVSGYYAASFWKAALCLKAWRWNNTSNALAISGAKYNPFEIVKCVSQRAGVSLPELLFVSKYSGIAGILSMRGKNVIVCQLSVLFASPPEEFEGVVAHEIGHLFDRRENRFMKYIFPWIVLQVMFLPIFFQVSSDTSQQLFLESDWDRIAPAVYVVGAFLAFLIRRAIYCLSMRQNEFLADRKALSFTRYPESFVNFLSKIMVKEEKLFFGMSGASQNFTANPPLTTGVFETHPTIWSRVVIAKRILEKRDAKK